MMRDDVTKWAKVRKMEPKATISGRHISVKGKAAASCGPDQTKEPC